MVEDNEELIAALAQRKQLMRDIDSADARIRLIKSQERAKAAAPTKKAKKKVSAEEREAIEVGETDLFVCFSQ